MRPLQAIRKKCLDCCGGSKTEVARCEINDCPLWPLRFGKRPETIRRRSEKRNKMAVPSNKTQNFKQFDFETEGGGYPPTGKNN